MNRLLNKGTGYQKNRKNQFEFAKIRNITSQFCSPFSVLRKDVFYVLLLVIMGVDTMWMLLLTANDVIMKELFDNEASMWSITEQQ